MATINFRVDDNVKVQAARVFDEIGLDVTTALNIFLRAAIYYNGIPFELRRPNPETLAAMEEAKNIASGEFKAKAYDSFGDLVKELEEEIAQEEVDV